LKRTSRPSKNPNSEGEAALPPVLNRHEQALQERNTYIAAAAHDMKNQLAVIRGIAQLLERQVRNTGATEPAALLDDLATIQGSTGKLQRLVDELLDLSRLQSGEPVQFNQQPTDLVAVARVCMHEYAEVADHKLSLSTAAATVIGQWDATRLERVVANLLSNAIKYSTPTSVICITLAVDRNGGGDVAVLAVQDRGVGIPEADLPHICAPYYRGSNVAQTTIGTGIGLFGARAIIEQQGGSLQVDSTEGVGTTVTIRLPVAPIPIVTLGTSLAMTLSVPTS
jgi:signal transduction histidine kinase